MSSSGALTGCHGCKAYRLTPRSGDGGLRFGSFYVAETGSSRPTYYARVLKSLTRKGKSQEDAEDLLQEALLRLHIYAKDHAVLNKEAFLRQAVHNLSIDHYRHHRLGALLELPLENVEELTPLVDPRPTPEQILDSQQRLEELTALLEAVSPRTREIYIANQYGYTRAEIANEMGIARITVNRHMRLAQAALPKKDD